MSLTLSFSILEWDITGHPRCKNCFPNIVPRELHFCTIFEKTHEFQRFYDMQIFYIAFWILYTVPLADHEILTFRVPQ